MEHKKIYSVIEAQTNLNGDNIYAFIHKGFTSKKPAITLLEHIAEALQRLKNVSHIAYDTTAHRVRAVAKNGIVIVYKVEECELEVTQ